MRILPIIMLTFFIASCSSTGTRTSSISASMNLNTVAAFKVGQTDSSTILKSIGQPSNNEMKESKNIWTYFDSKSGSQRLTIAFDTKTDKVLSIVWIPLANEREVILKNTLDYFSQATFKATELPQDNSHALSTQTLYSDSSMGLSILHENARNSVEAVIWSAPNQRTPSAIKTSTPYKL